MYPERKWASPTACASYFHEMLFENPWHHLGLPSWVAEENRRITGLLCVMPRPMMFRGRQLRVAVNTQFMMDPEKRGTFTTLQLARAAVSGPQDLTFADGANDQARRMWIAIGGTVSLPYSLHWTRPLRPARQLLSLLEEHDVLHPAVTLAMRPLGALADALAARLRPNRILRQRRGLSERALEPATMLANLPAILRDYALQPVYNAHSLAWLLDQAARKTCHGKLRARAVLDDKQRLIGWYLYYLRPGGLSEVVQVAALKGSHDSVLTMLLADAWRHGAATVRGRLDPRSAQDLSDRHCWFRRDSTWTLFHSRHPEIMDAIHQGDALLSRLEGEWWMRFHGEEEAGTAQGATRDRIDDSHTITSASSLARTQS